MTEYTGVQFNRTPGVPASAERPLRTQLEIVLTDQGVSFDAATMRPIETLVKLLNDREDADWRDAFMAAITAGRPVSQAELTAVHAAEALKQRRRARLEAGS